MEEYLGFKDLYLSEEELAALYENPTQNTYDLMINEYLLVRDADGNLVDQFRWDGGEMQQVKQKTIKGKFVDTIKPRNPQQILALDMLYNPTITVKLLTGGYGVGKDALMMAAAMDMIERGRYDRLVYVRNNIEVRDSKPIGYLPGSGNEKLLPFAMPLVDKLGGMPALEMKLSEGEIELVHLGFMRGRDIKNAIIYVTEAENMTKEHIQLLIGRVAEGSSLWINGDYKQTDAKVFEENNGIMRMIEKLKGNPLFGYVKLIKTERSATAALADLLD